MHSHGNINEQFYIALFYQQQTSLLPDQLKILSKMLKYAICDILIGMHPKLNNS